MMSEVTYEVTTGLRVETKEEAPPQLNPELLARAPASQLFNTSIIAQLKLQKQPAWLSFNRP